MDLGGDSEQELSTENIGWYKTKVNETLEEMKRLVPRNNVQDDMKLGIYVGVLFQIKRICTT